MYLIFFKSKMINKKIILLNENIIKASKKNMKFLEFIYKNAAQGALIILDDFGGWFTDGVTKFGNELKSDKRFFVAPNHLGQLLIYKI